MACPLLIWLYGLPDSGQDQLAAALAEALARRGIPAQTRLLDPEAELAGGEPALAAFAADAAVLAASGEVVIASSISATERLRQLACEAALSRRCGYLDLYLRLPIDLVLGRAPQGLLAQALDGKRNDVPGVSGSYQQPLKPQIVLEASGLDLTGQVRELLAQIAASRLLPELPYRPAELEAEMADPFAQIPAEWLLGLIDIDDALDEPQLVGTWAQTFSASDQAILVFYAADLDPRTAIEELAPLIEEQGMAAPGSGELLLLAGRRSDTVDAQIAARVDLQLTGNAKSGLALQTLRPTGSELRQLLEEKQHGRATND